MSQYRLYDDPTPGKYLYYYTSTQVLALTLDTGRLRFGQYSTMNDPRERQAWFPDLSYDDLQLDLPHEEWLQIMSGVDSWLRQGVRLKCFTLDEAAPAQPAWQFHRGWARARMWHQYAGNHTGACLVFDAQRLMDNVISAASDRRVVADRVAYVDRPIVLGFDLTEVRGAGLRDAAIAARDEQLQELFFIKNTDWASEREFRIIVLGEPEDPDLDVPIAESLSAVIVGETFPSTELSVLETRLARLDGGVFVGQCAWQSGGQAGAPGVYPANTAPAGT